MWIAKALGDSRIRFYNLSKRGAYPKDVVAKHQVAGSDPLNEGFKRARGKWITICEDDDSYTCDHIESLLSFAKDGNFEWVTGAFLEELKPREITRSNAAETECMRLSLLKSRTAMSCWMFRSYIRCFKFDLLAWRYNMNGDKSFKERLSRAGVEMGYLDHVVTERFLRPGEQKMCREGVLDRIRRGISDDD